MQDSSNSGSSCMFRFSEFQYDECKNLLLNSNKILNGTESLYSTSNGDYYLKENILHKEIEYLKLPVL